MFDILVDDTLGEGPLSLVLGGDLDFAEREELAAVVAAFADSDHDSARIDLSRVEFIDSTGVRALEAMQTLATTRGGTLTVDGVGRQARRVFDLMGFHELLGAS